MIGWFHQRRRVRLARTVREKLDELLEVQNRNALVELSIDGTALHEALRAARSANMIHAVPKRNPTPRIARRARMKRRNS